MASNRPPRHRSEAPGGLYGTPKPYAALGTSPVSPCGAATIAPLLRKHQTGFRNFRTAVLQRTHPVASRRQLSPGAGG
jgi:hypothetical protein